MKLYQLLNFGGNCEEAFRYYEAHLDGTIDSMMRVSDLPPGTPRPPGSADAVIHARLKLAGTVLMGNDVPPEDFQPMRSCYVHLAPDSVEAAERIYAALADGGDVRVPLGETFFASRFAQLRDRFGTLWSVVHERPM